MLSFSCLTASSASRLDVPPVPSHGLISASTLLLGVVASGWFWNEEDSEVDPDVDEGDRDVVLEDMVEFFFFFL